MSAFNRSAFWCRLLDRYLRRVNLMSMVDEARREAIKQAHDDLIAAIDRMLEHVGKLPWDTPAYEMFKLLRNELKG